MNCRTRLRNATAALHRQVDAAFSAFRLEQADDYRRFLRAHARVIPALEQALGASAATAHLPDWPQRCRSNALLADLAELDEAPPPAPFVALGDDEGAFWGAAYVLEGSRLGAQLLLQRVRQGAAERPQRYLGHAAGETLWPRFLQRLEARASYCDEAALQAAAGAVFSRFAAAARLERSLR
ncbi:biliverdin-producing heme oxygenase [Pseudomonas oligotrophica]|uniref:biliverdin-producing heme oxygenase n=1 Tax=Pseudomonas oligotrophica TaxID=2912055 RepID=UPI001F4354F9|nr:biliverdin-producing heme oxygenase [Pseudomonas oligotrophica]MCF7200714.1 biliverdin-producing heme oxygenase [Pseudomonas oligotrophica]